MIEKIPRSLVQEISLKFFDVESTAAFIHVHENQFRLIIRRANEETEGFCTEVIFNDFVMTQMFDSRSGSASSNAIQRSINGQKMEKSELDSLQTTSFIDNSCAWLQEGQDKRVGYG